MNPVYRRLRWQIFMGIFLWLRCLLFEVRKNFLLAMPYLVEEDSLKDLGFAFIRGSRIAYGFSKFIVGVIL